MSSYSTVYAALSLKSAITQLRSLGKRPTIHFERPYDDRPILLLALYQKGVLRPDTIRLLNAAKAAGIYVLAVNTLKLSDPFQYEDLIDCYIERFNFGRDFGSYKLGFLHLFKAGYDKTCPRLVLLNDSVFFTESRMPEFLTQMLKQDVEILGGTENFEIEYHLGSFCIAMSGHVLRQPRFQRYWRRYRNSDVRPTVIYRGEMGLSRMLRRCISAPDQMRALFSSSQFLEQLNSDAELVDFAIKNARVSSLTGWKRFSRQQVLQRFQDMFQTDVFSKHGVEINIDADPIIVNEKHHLNSLSELAQAAKRHLTNNSADVDQSLHRTLLAELVAVFMQGSQIHQNAAILVKMGLPIIKLDGFYRGMFSVEDIQAISGQLEPLERRELQSLLMQRPYGGDTLIAWKRVAFMRGLI